jgi:hypothetical protein
MPQKRIHKRYGALAVAAAIAIIVSFFIAAKSTIDRRSAIEAQRQLATRADYDTCLRLNKLYGLIQQQVRLSIQTTPTLEYYKNHPAELATVQARARQEIQAFAPEKCKEAK